MFPEQDYCKEVSIKFNSVDNQILQRYKREGFFTDFKLPLLSTRQDLQATLLVMLIKYILLSPGHPQNTWPDPAQHDNNEQIYQEENAWTEHKICQISSAQSVC